jgi:hypothetical protein
MVKHRKSVIRTKDVGTRKTGEISSVSEELVLINCEWQKSRRRLLDRVGRPMIAEIVEKGSLVPLNS